MTFPTHADYPATDPVMFERTVSLASLAVAFYDICKEGQMASSTASLLANTFLQAMLLGTATPTLDITDTPVDTASS